MSLNLSRWIAVLLAAGALAARASAAANGYGAKGLFPVYAVNGHWIIYDKAGRRGSKALRTGSRFLLIGRDGAGVFSVARMSTAYGGSCRERKPLRLRVAVLEGPRKAAGEPLLAVEVPKNFTLRGSRAVETTLADAATEELYKSIGPALVSAAIAEAKSGAFHFKADDDGAAAFLSEPRPDKALSKIDFAAAIPVAALKKPLVLVTSAQISRSSLRCLRLADGNELIGGCVEMPHELMAETSLLDFISYDAGGKGRPLLIAATKGDPLWGQERWAFALSRSGPRPLLSDAMDPRCREGF